MTRRRPARTAALWSIALVCAVISIFPFYWMLNTSLKPAAEVFVSPPTFVSSHWSFDAYANLFATRSIGRYFLNSVIVSVGSTALCVFLAALAAYGLTRFFPRGATPFVMFLLFTKMLPETLLIIPYFQLMSDVGLLNTHLALILAYSSFALPFSVWMLIGFFRSIPREIDEAAMIDGATRIQALWRVILPIVRPGMVTAALFGALFTWNEFLVALYVIDSRQFQTISLGAATLVSAQRPIDWNIAAAVGIVTVVPILIFSLFVQRYIVRGLTAGAVK